MPDKKLTDEEIKKAFKICNNLEDGYCSDCAYEYCDRCIRAVAINTLDLINSLQAENERLKENLQEAHIDIREHITEIERLNELLEEWKKAAYKVSDEKDELYCNAVERVKTAKAEAYKEFAERLKEHSYFDPIHQNKVVAVELVDNLLKEIVGETNG